MTEQSTMLVLYPILTGLCGGYVILKFVFWWTTRRTKVTLLDAIFFTIETIVLFSLTNQNLHNGEYGLLVVAARVLKAIALILCIITTWQSIRLQGVR